MNDLNQETEAKLLAEKCISAIWFASVKPSIKLSSIKQFNVWFVLLFIPISIFVVWSCSFEIVVTQIRSLASTGVDVGYVLLGFLVAGFCVVATAGPPDFYIRISTIKHCNGLTQLKYNLFSFVRLFAELFAFCFICTTIRLFGFSGSSTNTIFTYLDDTSKMLIVKGLLVFMSVFLVHITIQVKSFLFNVYHLAMTFVAYNTLNRQDIAEHHTEINVDVIADPDSIVL